MQPTRIERTSVRTDWASQGFTCETWIDPPEQTWHDLQHEVDAIVLLIDGESQVELPHRTVRLHAGDELQIPAGVRHTVRNCGSRPARWLRGFRASANPADATG
jgi:cupin 2 domain-containing protein